MSTALPEFREPSGVERIFNKIFGALVGLGLAPRYNYLVQVARPKERPRLFEPEILRAYLDRYKLAVQRFFPVRTGSEAPAFQEIADRYPVFELLDAAA